MGSLFSSPVVHEEQVKTVFRANSCGAYLVEIVGLLAVALLPLVVGFSMGQFWTTFNTFEAMPNATYTGKVMMKASSASSTAESDYLWASSAMLQDALVGDPRACQPMFTVLRDDHNRDNFTDEFILNLHLPLRDSNPITYLELLPEFRYGFKNDLLALDMATAPLITIAVPPRPSYETPLRVIADGQLKFTQTEALGASVFTRYDVVYKRSYFDDVVDVSDLSEMGRIGRRYNARNESTPFQLSTQYLSGDYEAIGGVDSGLLPQPNLFSVTVHLRVPKAVVHYTPSFSESLKDGWVEYFCIAYVIHWAYNWVRRIFVMNALVNTIAILRGRQL